MRIVHLSTYDLYGGAGRAAFQLHVALQAAGEESRMVVRQRRSERGDVRLPGGRLGAMWSRVQRRIDRLPLAFRPPTARGFSVGWVPDLVKTTVRRLRPDVVHVHWIADGFVRPESVARFGVPTVWTMHDMWAFTGGCHYAGECGRFAGQCGACPQLGSTRDDDLSRAGWNRRHRSLSSEWLTIVTPSRWMASQVRRSSLLGLAEPEVIPNGFDTVRFAPRERTTVREELGFERDATIVLTGAAQLSVNSRKGFSHLTEALERLGAEGRTGSTQLAVFGAETELPPVRGIRVVNLGPIADPDRLARVYAAADIFAVPSLSDNLPNTAIEAMASGVPVVAYDAGGIPEIVDHEINGLLVSVGRTDLLASALDRLIQSPPSRVQYGRAAREKALRRYSLDSVVAAHRRLYQRIVSAA